MATCTVARIALIHWIREISRAEARIIILCFYSCKFVRFVGKTLNRYWPCGVHGGRFAKIVQGKCNQVYLNCRAEAYLTKNAPTRYFLFSRTNFFLSPWYFFLSYKKVFVTNFVTHVRKFVTHITKFVIHVTKFVTKNICADNENYQAERKNLLGDSENYLGHSEATPLGIASAMKASCPRLGYEATMVAAANNGTHWRVVL